MDGRGAMQQDARPEDARPEATRRAARGGGAPARGGGAPGRGGRRGARAPSAAAPAAGVAPPRRVRPLSVTPLTPLTRQQLLGETVSTLKHQS